MPSEPWWVSGLKVAKCHTKFLTSKDTEDRVWSLSSCNCGGLLTSAGDMKEVKHWLDVTFLPSRVAAAQAGLALTGSYFVQRWKYFGLTLMPRHLGYLPKERFTWAKGSERRTMENNKRGQAACWWKVTLQHNIVYFQEESYEALSLGIRSLWPVLKQLARLKLNSPAALWGEIARKKPP